ncbi:MAG: hypothetical protein A2156_05270 [Deltaproteobacteria bacterium RBG_16_48_10]|nr:MAG: hypothetical protein A2156_05270 [Deltaproteobacteria bacterium RBG_16_48_10]
MKKFILLIPLWVFFIPAIAKSQVTYQKGIRPLFDAKCSMCHGPESPLVDQFKKEKERYTKENKGPRMDTYPLLLEFVKGSDTGAIMRRLDDGKSKPDGKPGNMYPYLGKDEEERQKDLKIFKDWVGSWNLKRKNELTEEELKKITALP